MHFLPPTLTVVTFQNRSTGITWSYLGEFSVGFFVGPGRIELTFLPDSSQEQYQILLRSKMSIIKRNFLDHIPVKFLPGTPGWIRTSDREHYLCGLKVRYFGPTKRTGAFLFLPVWINF